MKSLKTRIDELSLILQKNPPSGQAYDHQAQSKEYARMAFEDVQKLQQHAKQQRIAAIHGQSDLNPAWTFDNLIEDSDDVREAVSIASSFIAAHNDPQWRNSQAHMMLFYGDYGRGKSHIAGAIANALINQYEVSVLYRQLSTLLELRAFSYDFSAQDNVGDTFRDTYHKLLSVDLLIIDEVGVNQSALKTTAQSWLGNLLRQRSSDNKNCILITNHNLTELEQALGSYCFESIKEYETYMVQFSGPSRRQSIVDANQDLTQTSKSGYVPNQVK